jgi:hypothetical protein
MLIKITVNFLHSQDCLCFFDINRTTRPRALTAHIQTLKHTKRQQITPLAYNVKIRVIG